MEISRFGGVRVVHSLATAHADLRHHNIEAFSVPRLHQELLVPT
jgi:hypothetical protein